MTKKHFIALAAALLHEKPAAHWDPNKMVQWQLDCRTIARTCHSFNPAFSTDRFLAACNCPTTPV